MIKHSTSQDLSWSSLLPLIETWIIEHKVPFLAFLSRLIQIPSEVIPPIGNERFCQEFVAEAYRQAGAQVDVFSPADIPELFSHPAYYGTWDGVPRDLTNRPVVVGTFPGEGGGRSLIFSTHIDTVPAGDPTEWKEASPFSGEIKNGRLYGRGSWDTKWGIATSLFAVRCVKELGFQLRGDVIVESVCDEEYGGSHGCLASRLRGYNADFAINSEPTSMVVAPAHRGGTAWKITVRGERGRGFTGKKLADPVYKLARVIQALRAYDQQRIPADAPPRFYESDPALPTYIQQVGGGGTTFAQAIGVPAECYLSIWTEEHPDTDEKMHTQRFQEFINSFLAQDADFDGIYPEYTRLFRYIPGSSIDPSHPFLEHLQRSFASAGVEYKVEGAKFACDTYIFNLYSPTPAVTLGPRGGNAHSPDEYVIVQDLLDLTRIYARLILEWCF